MLIDLLGDLNWLAVVVATVAWYAFSAIWYTALSKPWIQASGVNPQGQGQGNMPPPTTMIGTFIAYLVTTAVIGLLVLALNITEVPDAIELGVLLGLAFGVVSAFIVQIYEQKGAAYWWINGIASIIAYSIVSVILALWT